MAAFQNLPILTVRRMIQRVNGKTVGAAGRSGGRNERIVVSAKRDGKRPGPDVNQTVAARALGWRSEVSAVNRTHGPARCLHRNESDDFAMSATQPTIKQMPET